MLHAFVWIGRIYMFDKIGKMLDNFVDRLRDFTSSFVGAYIFSL